MKTIILISSIFYILGLKVSDKINLVNRINPVPKIITNTITSKHPSKTYIMKEEKENKITKADSLKENSDNKVMPEIVE